MPLSVEGRSDRSGSAPITTPATRTDLGRRQTAAGLRAALGLSPHPEGGWYRETWRDVPAPPQRRGAATAILFLLAAGEISAWHRIDAVELWLWHGGAPLILRLDDGERRTLRIGPGVSDGERLQGVVPAHTWQSAQSAGDWTLVSCVVAPAFEFAGFELAQPGLQGKLC